MNPNYIQPPNGDEVEWFSGPPPEVGWWPASTIQRAENLRYWDGQCWSCWVYHTRPRQEAGSIARRAATVNEQSEIRWTHRWWEDKPNAENKSTDFLTQTLLASYIDETTGAVDEVHKHPKGRTVTVLRKSGYGSHNGRDALCIQDTGNGLIARFPPVTSTEQDYFVCLDYSQARDLALGLLGHNDALRIKEVG